MLEEVVRQLVDERRKSRLLPDAVWSCPKQALPMTLPPSPLPHGSSL